MAPDTNNNSIPDRWDRRIEAVLKIGVALLVLMTEGKWFPDANTWLLRALGVIVVVSGLMGWKVGKAAAVGIMVLGLGVLSTGCSPYAAAWRTTGAVQSAGNLTDRAIAAAARPELGKCNARHGAKTKAAEACLYATTPGKALKQWVTIARPAVNSALIATVTSLQVAERAKNKKLDWLAILRPAGCALAKIVEQFGHLLGPQRSAILVAVGVVKGVSCE